MDRTNQGYIGINKLKKKDDHPDYSGKINVNGTDYWLAGWKKEKNGSKFLSLAIETMDGKYSQKKKEDDNPF